MAIEIGGSIGHYKIVSKIGSGGMGEVYLAGDTKLERRVAIKFLRDELSKDADKLNRFIQEAKAASALNHPNILTVYEIGEADGQNYIATELIDGKTLRAHLASKDEMPLNSILKIGVQVAEALSAAHSAGIVHRDIKPENIMIRNDGYAKVLDFGLAKLAESSPAASGSEDATRAQVNTMPGVVMGTAAYMSPEQARGLATDARTDIWSLGIVLYEMLAGRVPFSGETVNHTIVAILEREPLLLENVPAELQRIVRKALTKDKEMRYQSARDLLIDLKNLRRDLDIQGELERSVIPNRETHSQISGEGETQFYTAGAQRTASGQTTAAQNVTSSSSLEYAVNQVKSHKGTTAVVGVILAAAIGLIGYFSLVRTASGQINSIAVLPFENRSDDPNADYLSDGLSESLIYRLSQLPELKVSPTGSVMRYKGKGGSIAEIANDLGVQAVLTGRVVQRGDNLSISVELIDAANNKTIWGEQYEKKMSDLLATQREIATTITEKLQLKLTGDEKGITKKYTSDNEAYQLYLKGRFQWNKRTVDGLRSAEIAYKQAIEKDPSFALAYSGLAETYGLFANYSVASPTESFPKAKAAALKAIELDPTLAEPHAALGLYYTGYAFNDPLAEKALRRAIELNPNYATAWHWLGNATLISMQRFDEALAAGQRAIELDPLSAIISADQGWNYLFAHRYDDSIAQMHLTLKLDPNFYYAHYNLGWAYLEKKMYPEAIASLRRSLELNEDPYAKALLIRALAETGRRAESVSLRDELRAEYGRRYLAHYFLAIANLSLGDKDEAFALLDKDLDQRSIYAAWIRVDPTFDGVRDDPRYQTLVKKIGAMKLE
jgi:eukaryotic-like serine/threonine-protein kinase